MLTKVAFEVREYLEKKAGLTDVLLGKPWTHGFDATQFEIEKGKRLLGMLAGGGIGAAAGAGLGVGAGYDEKDENQTKAKLLGILGALGGGTVGSLGGSRLAGHIHAMKTLGLTGMMGQMIGDAPDAGLVDKMKKIVSDATPNVIEKTVLVDKPVYHNSYKLSDRELAMLAGLVGGGGLLGGAAAGSLMSGGDKKKK